VQDERNECKHEEDVNQASSDVKHRESTEPGNQKHDKQDHPNAHFSSLSEPDAD
jgi:hypothetical protein